MLVELAIEPLSRADAGRLDGALRVLVAEDAGFAVSQDRETAQIVIKGQSEQHLERIVDRLSRAFGVAIVAGAPQVAYRETPGRRAEIDYTHKKQSGGAGAFARVRLVLEPGAPGSGYRFDSKVVGGSLPEEYITGVEKGLEAARESGVLAGFPVIDFKVTLVDGAWHDVDSSVPAFEIAARAAFKEGLQKAQCTLLEPIMKVEVVTPEDCRGEVIDDLDRRRGLVRGLAADGTAQVVTAMVPLANLFGYANTLRALTGKRATFSLVFDHYAPVPLPDDGDGPAAPAVALRG
jgi:elongation factor G